MPPFAGMARVEVKLASMQSEAKEKGKLRNELLDRSTRLFAGMALQSGDQVRRCVCQRLGRHPVKVVRTKYCTKYFLVSLKPQKALHFSENVAPATLFSTWTSHESARRNKKTRPSSSLVFNHCAELLLGHYGVCVTEGSLISKRI